MRYRLIVSICTALVRLAVILFATWIFLWISAGCSTVRLQSSQPMEAGKCTCK